MYWTPLYGLQTQNSLEMYSGPTLDLLKQKIWGVQGVGMGSG